MTVMAHSFCAVTFFLNIVRIPAPKAPAWQVMKAHPLPLNQRDIRWPSVLLWDTQYLLSTKFVFTSFKETIRLSISAWNLNYTKVSQEFP